MADNINIHRLNSGDKEIILVGTAHVSKESAELVTRVIEEDKPDTVCVELCESRYQTITQKNKWRETNLFKVIKEKKAFLLLMNLMLSSFQKRIGDKLGIKPGEEMIQALKAAEQVDARVHLADRDIRVTLARTWRLMGLWSRFKLLGQFVASVFGIEDIEEADVEEMKNQDVLETLLAEIGKSIPELKRVLIDERDLYLGEKIRTAPGKKIVAVVGAGHVPGIKAHWGKAVNIEALEQMPPKGRLGTILKWGIPGAIIGLIIWGFFTAGASAGTDMIKLWVIANALFTGIGTSIALAHPVTILAAMLAAPLTSLNPMIAAGWVAGLVEAFMGQPKVRDFELLSDDISSVKGFWRNKVTKILLVVVFANIGSSIGTFVAIPLMTRIFL